MAYKLGAPLEYDPFEDEDDPTIDSPADSEYKLGEPSDYDPFEGEDPYLNDPKSSDIDEPDEGGHSLWDIPRLMGKGAAGIAKTASFFNSITNQGEIGAKMIGAFGDLTDNETMQAYRDYSDKHGVSAKLKEYGEEAERYYDEKLTPAMKASMEKTILASGEEEGFFGPGASDPWKIAGLIAESIPSTIISMGGSMIITKGLIQTGLKAAPKIVQGVIDKMVKKYGVNAVAGVIGGAAGEGGYSGLENASQAYQEMMDLPQEELIKSRAYDELYNSMPDSLSTEQKHAYARKALAMATGAFVGLPTALSTGLFGAPSGAFMGKLIGGEGGKSLWGNLLKGAISEGFFEEMPQSGLERLISNIARKFLVDEDQEYLEGTGEAMASGAVAGFAMGGGMAAVAGRVGKESAAKDLLTDGSETTASDILLGEDEAKKIRDRTKGKKFGGSESIDAEEEAGEHVPEDIDELAEKPKPKPKPKEPAPLPKPTPIPKIKLGGEKPKHGGKYVPGPGEDGYVPLPGDKALQPAPAGDRRAGQRETDDRRESPERPPPAWDSAFRKSYVAASKMDEKRFVRAARNVLVRGEGENIKELAKRLGENIEEDTPIDEVLKTIHGRIMAGMEPRKKSSEMTEDELREAANTDYLTGLRNKQAFDIEDTRKKHVASIDLDSLKYFNDAFGHQTGDAMLINFGNALSQITDADTYHISGDEFIVQSDDSARLDDILHKRIVAALAKNPITITLPDGKQIKYEVQFSYGKAQTTTAAEARLQKHKAEREASGKRAGRGNVPAGLPGFVAKGKQAKGERERVPEKKLRGGARRAPMRTTPPDTDSAAKIKKELDSVDTDPTEGQKKAGNYSKGHFKVMGFDVTIENPKGEYRRGTGADGKEWKTLMHHHYGYFSRTEGKDGDEIDLFMGEDFETPNIYIVHQVDPKTKKPDEDKVILGFSSEAEAKAAYHANYDDGWQGFGSMITMDRAKFADWLDKQTKEKAAKKLKKTVQGATNIKMVTGKRVKIVTPGNKRGYLAHYALVEADDLTPSHNARTFQKNPKYPPGIQERTYDTDPQEQEKVRANAAYLNPHIVLSDDPTPTNGPPIVTATGIVLGGNSRAMSLQLAYAGKKPKRAIQYKNALTTQAIKFGFVSTYVSGMEKPVLVRMVYLDEVNAKVLHRMASDFNKSLTQGVSQEAEIASMGKNISLETIEKIGLRMANRDLTLRELLGKKDGTEILQWLIEDGVIASGDKNKFVSQKVGLLNDTGKNLIEKALFGSIIDDPDLLSAAPKTLLNKIGRLLPSLAKIKARGGKWDITPDVKDALELATKAKGMSLSIREFLKQRTLFGDEKSFGPIAQTLGNLLVNENQSELAKRYKAFASDAMADSKGQTFMFAPRTFAESITANFGLQVEETPAPKPKPKERDTWEVAEGTPAKTLREVLRLENSGLNDPVHAGARNASALEEIQRRGEESIFEELGWPTDPKSLYFDKYGRVRPLDDIKAGFANLNITGDEAAAWVVNIWDPLVINNVGRRLDALKKFKRRFPKRKKADFDPQGEPTLSKTLKSYTADIEQHTSKLEAVLAYGEKMAGFETPSPKTEIPAASNQVQKIRELYDFALSDKTNVKKEVVYRKVDENETKFLKNMTGLDVEGYSHVVDNYAVGHIIKNHGDAKTEKERGLIAVTKDDVSLIPDITLNPDNVVDGGKTKTGLDSIRYEKKVNGTIIFIEEVRTGKGKKQRLAAVTMYKRLIRAPRATSGEGVAHTSGTFPDTTKMNIDQFKPKVKQSSKLADWVSAALHAAEGDDNADHIITWRELFKKADKFFGGTQAEGAYTPRDAYDAMELGVNRYILKYLHFIEGPNNSKRTPESIIDQLRDLVEYLPTQSKRTQEQEDFQQYSTPPFLAYVANWVAYIGSNDVYLEPSAGIGGLAIFGRMTNAARIYVNELSERRRELLRILNIANETFGEDAIQLDNILPDYVKPTVVVMNPPFSSTGGRLKKNATAYGAQHVEQALNRLEPGGRLVAIVGRGMEMNAPTFRKWWTDIRKKYNVRANIGISGDEYRKYGTTFDNRIIIIDKSGPTEYDPVVADVETVSELPDLLRGIRNDRPETAKPDQEGESGTVQPPLSGTPDKGEGTPSGPPSTRPESSDLGDKDGGDQADTDNGSTGAPSEQPPGLPTGPRGQLPGPKPPPETGGAPGPSGHPPGGAPRSGDGEPGGIPPEAPGDLSVDDISDIFDDVVDELEKEKTETQPPQTPESGPPLGPMGGPSSTPQPGPAPPKTPSKGGYGDIADLINNAKNQVKEPQTPYNEGKKPPDVPLMLPEIYARAKAEFSEQYAKFMEGAKDLKKRAHEWIKDAVRGLIANGVTDLNIAKNWVLHFYENDRPGLEPPSTKKASAPGELDVEKKEKEIEDIRESLYQRYIPAVKIKGAKKHPTQLDESAALGDTKLPPATYKPKLPQKMIDDGKTSDAQLEFVVYAGQAHDGILASGERRGIMAGHGTGVGKGRIIAAVILDNWNHGRKKAIWISEKEKLFDDAKRDMGYDSSRKAESGIGWKEGVDKLFYMKTKLGDTIPDKDGIMFTTYATLRSKFSEINENDPHTFDNMRVRINQIVKWAGKDYDGVIAFDESHNMSNSLQQQTDRGKSDASAMALAGVMLQKLLPKARIIYVSATGATEVRNLAYAERLGLWGEGTAFASKESFITDINSRGLSAMELVARDLKSRGLYLAPALSYDGVKHDKLVHKLDDKQRAKYDELARAWQLVLHNIGQALGSTGQDQDGMSTGRLMSLFWGGQLRFFNQLITTMQMGTAIKHMEKEIAKGHAIIIQLVNHGGDQLKRGLAARDPESELEDMDLGPKASLLEYIDRAFPIQQWEPYVDANGNELMRPVVDSQGNPVINREALARKNEMMQRISAISIPGGPLDMIIHHFGPDVVAEVTGRGVRLIYDENGELVEDKRSKSKVKKDVDAYMDDEKQILVFSEMGGTGASYHADLDRINQRKRIHYLAQPGWRADKAIQGLGRSHRSNQKQAPGYWLLTTDLDAQKRFTSSIARRLDQLGSLTRGQRQTGSQGLFSARDNMESGYAANALLQLYRDIVEHRSAITAEQFSEQTALSLTDDDGGLLTALPPPTKFMNRLLTMEIAWQNKLFGEWTDRIAILIDAAVASGTLDVGIETIKALNIVKTDDRIVHTDKATGAKTQYISVDITTPSNRKAFEDLANVEKYYVNLRSGKIWGATPTRTMTTSSGNVANYRSLISPAGTVQRVAVENLGAQQGDLFEESYKLDSRMPWGDLNIEIWKKGPKDEDAQYRVELRDELDAEYRDYLVQHFLATTEIFTYSGQEVIDGKTFLVFDPKGAIKHRFTEITSKKEAAERWNKIYAETSSTTTRESHLMTGALLPIWDRLGQASTVHRLQTDEGERFLGLVIPNNNIDAVLTSLGATKSAKDYTGEDLVKSIMEDNATVRLANRWKIKKKTVSGDERIEVFGPDYDDFDNLERWGIIVETIAHKTRYFIPTGKNAAAAMNNVIAFSTVTNVAKPYAGPTLTNTVINEPKDINKLFGHPKQVQIKMFGGNQLNLFTDKPKAKAKKGPELPEPRQVVTMETTGDISHYGTKIRNAEEAAGLLSFLLRKGAEEAYTVAVDKDSNVVQIHRISKGTMSSASVPVLETGGTLLKAPGAAKVYFIHQHPSGHPKPSAEDHQVTRLIAAVAGMRDIEVQAIIMSDHPPVYIVFDPEDESGAKTYGKRPLTPEIRKRVKKNLNTKLPVSERFITPVRGYDTGTLPPAPSNSLEAIKYFKQVYHDMEGIMLLSAKNEDMGFIPWGKGENEKEFTARIISELDRHNALAMIINLKTKQGNHTLSKERARYLKALVKRARWFNTTVHEILVDDVSMADPGIIARWRNEAQLEAPDFFESLINEKNILFSRKVARPSEPMTQKAVQEVIDPLLSEMKTRPGVTVLRKQSGLPAGVQTYLKEQGATNDIVVAAVFEGQVYLVAENIENRHEAVKALLHEVMGHFGIRSILGDQLDSTLDRVYMAKRAEIKAVAIEYGFDLKTKEGRRAAADEWLAREAQTNPNSKWIDRVIAMIRKWLRKINPNLKFSDAEIRALLASARQYVRTGQPASVFPPIVFDRAPALADIWYSHMAAVVEKTLPKSGTSSSYLQALKDMDKSGKIKSEELEWSGVRGWLRKQKGKIKREDLLSWLDENNVKLEEINYWTDPDKKTKEHLTNRIINWPYLTGDTYDAEWDDPVNGQTHKFEMRREHDDTWTLDIDGDTHGSYDTEEDAKDAAEDWAEDIGEDAIEEMAQIEWEEHWDDVKPSWSASWYNELNGESIDFEIKKETEAGAFEVFEEGNPWDAGEGHFNSLPEAKNAVERYLKNSIEAMAEFNEGERWGQLEPGPEEPKHPGDRLNLPFGKNYRELLLTLPAKPTWRENILKEWKAFQVEMLEKYGTGWAQKDFRSKLEEKHFKKLRYFEAQDDRWRGDVSKRADDKKGIFTHPHWEGVKNLIVHVRFNERIDADGEKVLFLEELQSDWHQKGRKFGYQGILPEGNKIFQNEAGRWQIEEPDGTIFGGADTRAGIIRQFEASNAVPNAPFKSTKSWQLLAMKRMVRYAAENDFDRIAWTPGAVQNKRYSLSHEVNKIEVYPRTYAVTGEISRGASIFTKRGQTIELGINNDGMIDNSMHTDFKGKPLNEVVGKDVAKRIMEVEKGKKSTIEGLDLDIGGKEMIEFYDKMLPNNLNKFFGTAVWGKARVKVTNIEFQKTEAAVPGWHVLDEYGNPIEAGAFDTQEEAREYLLANLYGNGSIAQDQGVKGRGHEPVLYLPVTREMKAKALYEGMPLFMKKQGSIDVVGRLPENVKHRFARARGVPKKSWIESAKEKIDFVKSQKHHFPDIYTIGNMAEEDKLSDILRQHQEVPEYAKDQAARKVIEFTRNLTQDQYEVFRIHVILSDMVRDIETELLTDQGLKEGETLPFGFKSTQEIRDTLDSFNQLADQAPSIRKAISDRRNYINRLVKDMVKYKVLKKEVLKHKDYFHHQVLSYWAGNQMKTVGTSSADVRTHWRPWMVARKGSMLDYNTEYVEAEFAALSQQIAQIETARTLERVKNVSDIYKDLKTAAKFENLKNFYVQTAKNLSALFKETITVKDIHKDPVKLDPLFPYRQNIAMAGAGLEKMAYNGDLNVTSEWDDVVDALAEKYSLRKLSEEEGGASELGDISDARYFAFLSYLVGRGLPGANWAATIFKAIQGRNKTIKGGLGDAFITYQNIIPEHYVEWKPTPGKGWFWTNTIADDILQKIIAGEKALEDKDVRQALARGRDLVWVVPNGLAATMDNFRRYPDANSLGRVADWSLSAWKMWILINPRRWMRYNVNNMSGDLDITLAYAPGIATPARMVKALNDLRKWQKRGELPANIQAELDNARRKGVIGSGFAVQEVEDVLNIMSMDKFVRNVLLGEKPNIAMRYWQAAKGSTVLRENILRLAAYRWFREQLKAGNAVYGASKVHEIDSIRDMDDRAAKLARELIGDYGNISSAGQYIRRRLIPFYSWIEINAPRYVYLMRNLKSEDRHSDAANLRKRVAGILSAKVARGSVKLLIKANLLMGMVTLWNMLAHREEWEELGEAKRRQMHLILGRREDGTIMTIRFQGALSDALSFFALEDWPADISDLVKGKATISDKLLDAPKAIINRAVQGIRPEPKLLFESATGYRTFPDVFSPRPIRDRVENVLRTFSLDSMYRMAAGKPGRGKNMAEHFISDIKSLLIYTSDPGEQAYYDTRKVVFDWLGDHGEKRSSGRPTNRSNALYYYRQALKYGDLNAAKKYLEKYYTYPGATGRTLRKSIKRAHPLTSIPARRRFSFRESLTPEQANRLKIALKWYEKTYKEKDTEFRHGGPPAKQTAAK